MTLLDVHDLGVSWRKSPPVHELVAAYLLGDPEAEEQKRKEELPTLQDLQALVAAYGKR